MDYSQLGLSRVINAAGMMTALGGTTLHEDVIAAAAAAGRSCVDMEGLKDKAGEAVARLLQAEAAMITTGAAAGISIMVAAAVAGADPVRVGRLPDADWEQREIVIQAGHAIHFGGSVTQMIRLGGGRPLLAGEANHVEADQLEGLLGPRTAAFFFVQSHHAVQKGMLSLTECVRICRAKGVPVLVDAAAEEDLQRYPALADLVAYSGGKAIGGPTSGIIAGGAELIRACRMQERGIARTMKVGKETIMGLLAALHRYVEADHETERARQLAIVKALESGLEGLPGTTLTRLPDEAGRAILRLGLKLDEAQLGFSAHDLMKGLQHGAPPVVLRGHWAGTGTVAIDPRPIDLEDAKAIAGAVRQYYAARLGRDR